MMKQSSKCGAARQEGQASEAGAGSRVELLFFGAVFDFDLDLDTFDKLTK